MFNSYNKEALSTHSLSDIDLWFTSKPLSKRTFSWFMADIIKPAKYSRMYTPHCLIVTAITSMTEAGFEARQSRHPINYLRSLRIILLNSCRNRCSKLCFLFQKTSSCTSLMQSVFSREPNHMISYMQLFSFFKTMFILIYSIFFLSERW